jgi:hypothetical protein
MFPDFTLSESVSLFRRRKTQPQNRAKTGDSLHVS